MEENVFYKKPRTQRRVVVTGIGAVSPLGLSAPESFENAINAKSGIAKITKFDASDYSAQIAGEVKGFSSEGLYHPKENKKMDEFIQFSIKASFEALDDSGFEINDSNRERTGIFIGVGMGGLPKVEAQHSVLLNRGPNRVSPFFIPMVISNMASGQLSILTGAQGPNLAHTSACSSGAHAIGEAYRYIRDGLCDTMIAGGSEAVVCPMAIAGFSSMKALSTRNDSPEAASRPFDNSRDGFVLGEGAASLILESMESAKRRGAKIYAEISGYGTTSDAHHMTSPAPEGAGGRRAMELSLQDAEVNIDEVDYVNAHGTSTPAGDQLESQAVEALFKEHSKNMWISSTKSMTGHLLGAAGALESVFCVQSIQKSIVAPTINLDEPGENCNLDYVAHTARERKIRNCINNSFGFGGTNVSLLFSEMKS
ncbi:MAG: beta-ketoacyl-ACP synthase II [Bdellovibrionales bacterium]